MSDASREAILNRVRRALSAPSEKPAWLGHPETPGPFFSLPEPTISACRDRFREELTSLFGEFHEAKSMADARTWLATFSQSLPPSSKILSAGGASLDPLLTGLENIVPINPAGSSVDWAKAAAGITLCESLVAESGTIAVSAAQTGRAGSILPPIHLVVATADQLVPDLDTSLARLRERYPDALPSTMSWITGPSRTGDIEKILVLGAHGPKRLLVLLLPAGSLD
jgi:L-lactate dehydrogenase complex protein LldG